MSFDSRTMRKDDHPKMRVLSKCPNCVCIKKNPNYFLLWMVKSLYAMPEMHIKRG